jgi:hypothetical protein
MKTKTEVSIQPITKPAIRQDPELISSISLPLNLSPEDLS